MAKKQKPTFADRLKALRESAGMSQAELGEKAGLSRVAIHYLESGEREPTLGTAGKLADALGVRVDDLRGV